MIALALAAALAATPIQASSPTWLKCKWTETRTKIVAGKSVGDETSEQSRTYQFDSNPNRLSVYNPKALTLDVVLGVLVTDEAVSVQTTHNFIAASGIRSEFFNSVKIDRRTLEFSQLNSIEPLPFAPLTSAFTTGTGRCVKIAPEPLTPAQF